MSQQESFESFLLNSVYDIPSFIFVVAPDSGEIVYTNNHMISFFNKECIGLILKELFFLPDGKNTFTRLNPNKGHTHKEQTEFFDDNTDSWYHVTERVIDWVDGSKKIAVIMNEINSIKEMQNGLSEAHAQLAIKNKELEKVSKTDRLTQLCNRFYLDEVFDNEFLRASRYKKEFCVIIGDCDKFKLVNDTYGHQVGDTVLIELANILSKNVRATDIVGRWGGEEFLIIVPETGIDGAVFVAEKLRADIEAYDFPVIRQKTMSFGVACWRDGDKPKTLVGRADEALYLAKERGRNRVETI